MTQAIAKHSHELQWLRVADLIIYWPDAQRPPSERAAKKIAAEFDPDMVGTLTVCHAPNGKWHVCDGWHRRMAIHQLYGDDQRAPCNLVPASTAKEAARVFRTMNGNRTKPVAFDMFMKGVTAEAPEEKAIWDIVTGLGLRVSRSGTSVGTIQAVQALMLIYRDYGGDGLTRVLTAIRLTWGDESAGFDAHLMRGVAFHLYDREDPASVDLKRFAKRVARKWTPERIRGAGRSTREAFGGSQARAIAALLKEPERSRPTAREVPLPLPTRRAA